MPSIRALVAALVAAVLFAGCHVDENKKDSAPYGTSELVAASGGDSTSGALGEKDSAPMEEPAASPAGDEGAAARAEEATPPAEKEASVPAAVSEAVSGDATASEDTGESGNRTTEAAPDLPAACEEHLATLRTLHERIPVVFVDLERSLDEIDADLRRAIEEGEAFLEACGEAPQASCVRARLGRDYLARYRRHMSAVRSRVSGELENAGLPEEERRRERDAILRDESETYLSRIRELADEALEGASEGTECRYHALALRADLAARDYDFSGQVRWAKALLEEFPGAEHRSKFLLDVGKALNASARYEEAVEWLRGVVEDHGDDDNLVGYEAALFDALTGAGDLEGMLALQQGIRDRYLDRAQAVESPHYRRLYVQQYDIAGFWIGRTLYTLGEVDGARKALERCKAHLETKRAQLQKQGKDLPNVQRITLEFRVNDYLYFLENHQGRRPYVSESCAERIQTADLSEGILWVTETQRTFADAQGRVFPILFRLSGNRRSRSFFQDLDDWTQGREAFAPLHLAYLPNGVSEGQIQQRVQRLRAERRELAIDMPAGYDRSPYQCVFRSLHATVGSPTLIVYDREGRAVWYLPDPRPMDRAVAQRVLERLAGKG